jgi:hypothetical protein
MKTKTSRTLRLILSPLGLYSLYILNILITPQPYLIKFWIILIYFSILLQGCRLLAMAVLSLGVNIFLNRPLSPSCFNAIAVILVGQLICWPLFFLHSTYIILLPYAISIGVPDAPTPSRVDLGTVAPFYLLYVLVLPFLIVTLGLLLFLCFSHRLYQEKCITFTIFVSTFTIVLVLNVSGIAPIPNELLYIFWLLPSILVSAYLVDRQPTTTSSSS